MSSRRVAPISLCILTALVGTTGLLAARGGWDDPVGGWDYVLEADAGQDVYLPYATGDYVDGVLDGSWRGGKETHMWDGTTPGALDMGNAAGRAPGGAAIASYPVQGEGGTTASALSLEVVGDTTDAAGNPFNFAWDTPANESIYFFRGTYRPGTTTTGSVNKGMTVIARWRLKPNPTDVESPSGQGSGFTTDGKGMISVVDQGNVNASLSLNDEGKLILMDQFELPFTGNPTGFLTTWLSVIQISGSRYQVEVYLNGSETAAFSQEVDGPPTGDETGSNPDDYIAFGLPVTGAAGALELDYIGYKIGFVRPGDPAAAPTGLACAIDDGVDPHEFTMDWTIPAGAVYDTIEIVRDGEVVETIAGDAITYTTTDLEYGGWIYGVSAVIGGTTLLPVTCNMTYCPGRNRQARVDYSRNPPAVQLTWGEALAPVTAIEIRRDGELLVDNLPGTATEYLDTTLTWDGGVFDYELTFVGAAALRGCDGTENINDVMIIPREKPYLDPPGGWDVVYNPDSHNPTTNPMDQYVDQKGVEGALDGTWIRSNRLDWWDGSAPGEFTAPDDPNPIAPGGLEIRDRPGEGLNGQAIKTLAIEDVGDPRDDGYAEPSNRKIYLGHLLDPSVDAIPGGRLAEGLTLYARFRILPDPKDVLDPPNGEGVRDSNRGMIMLAYYDGDPDVTISKSWAMSLDNDTLSFTSAANLTGFEPGEWVSVWVTIEDVNGNDNYHTDIYVNGATVAFRNNVTNALDNWEERLFVDDTIPFSALCMGMVSTDNDGAVEIDFVKVKYGEFAPTVGIGGEPLFFRGAVNEDDKVNVADAIAMLGFLFSGAAAPTCQDAADANDDGKVNVADAIALLGHLFSATGPLPAPSELTCGPDQTPDDLPPCVFPGCAR